jgi:hypothetical protein
MHRSLAVVLLVSMATLLPAAAVPASAQEAAFCRPGESPQFTFGFATLKAQLGAAMGDPIECAHPNDANGDVLQQTTAGLSFWRKSTNTPTFTNGWEHWGLTPGGAAYWTGESIDPPGTAVAAPSRPAPAASAPPATSPTLSISASAAQIEAGQALDVTVVARSSQGLDRIEVTANGDDPSLSQSRQFACEGRTACASTWTIMPTIGGSYTMTARAVDGAGQGATATTALTVRGSAQASAPPVPAPAAAPAPVVRDPILLRGKGQTATDPVTPPSPVTVATFTHDGQRNFIVKSFAGGHEDLQVNKIGRYQGQRPIFGSAPVAFDVQADGAWTIQLAPVATGGDAAVSGTGDTVSALFTPPASGAWQISHNGTRNFIVHLHCASGSDLVQNQIGPVEGSRIVQFGRGPCLWEIQADGAWSLRPR